jgi:hypothetical protein
MLSRRIAVAGASYSNDDVLVVDILSAPEEISGADIVIATADKADELAYEIRDRAPNSVVIVVGGSPHNVCETTLFPRARIVGVETDEEAAAVADAVVYNRGTEFETIVRCQGERGIEDDFVRVPVRIGSGGVLEIVED